jgi:hypothetical protein
MRYVYSIPDNQVSFLLLLGNAPSVAQRQRDLWKALQATVFKILISFFLEHKLQTFA